MKPLHGSERDGPFAETKRQTMILHRMDK